MKIRDVVVFFVVLAAVPRFCYAYIDPSTGSLVVQVAIGSAVGAFFAVKVFWKKIVYTAKDFFGRNKR